MASLKQLASKIAGYFNPQSNAGQNFWSSPIAQKVANVQQKIPQSAQRYIQSIPQRANQPNIFGPFGQLTGFGQSYTQNRIIEPLKSAGRDIQQTFAPSTPLLKRPVKLGTAGFNTLSAGFSAIPSPWLAGFSGYEYMKGQRAGQLKGEGFLKSQLGGIKSVTGSKAVGFGEALSTDPTKQLIGNIAELPLMMATTRKITGKGKIDQK